LEVVNSVIYIREVYHQT